MQLSRLLLRVALLCAPVALFGTVWLYLYPIFQGCAFPTPPPTHAQSIAPFRLLALGDPQLEGDSSLPRANASVFPSLEALVPKLRNTTTFGEKGNIVVNATRGVVRDAGRWLEGKRKAIDLWGNDWYLAHIVRSQVWWTEPTHISVLGDLLGSQWITDGEFERRAGRYWNIVMNGLERVPDSVFGVEEKDEEENNVSVSEEPAETHIDEGGIDLGADTYVGEDTAAQKPVEIHLDLNENNVDGGVHEQDVNQASVDNQAQNPMATDIYEQENNEGMVAEDILNIRAHKDEIEEQVKDEGEVKGVEVEEGEAKKEDVDEEATKEEEVQTEQIKQEEAAEVEIKDEEVKVDVTEEAMIAENIKEEDVKEKDVKEKDVKGDDIKLENAKEEEVKEEKVGAEVKVEEHKEEEVEKHELEEGVSEEPDMKEGVFETAEVKEESQEHESKEDTVTDEEHKEVEVKEETNEEKEGQEEQNEEEQKEEEKREHKTMWGGRTEVLGADKSWEKRVINIAGNHDVGYAGDLDQNKVERFEKAFGSVNWDIWFTLPEDLHSTNISDPPAEDQKPPALRLVILNTMNFDTPAWSGELQTETYDFMNHVITTAREVEDKTHATILLTHIPLLKEAGVCVDSPMFAFWDGGGVKEQNMISDHGTRIVLEGIFGLSKEVEAAGEGLGRRGIVVNGHDHAGCDVLHWIRQPGKEDQCNASTVKKEEAYWPPIKPTEVEPADTPIPTSPNEAVPFVEYTSTSELGFLPAIEPIDPEKVHQWRARRFPTLLYDVNEDDECTTISQSPQIREITLRSMMGEFAGYAGFLSAWFDTSLGERGEWVFEFSRCSVGIQHWWWGVHSLDFALVVLLISAGVASITERQALERYGYRNNLGRRGINAEKSMGYAKEMMRGSNGITEPSKLLDPTIAKRKT